MRMRKKKKLLPRMEACSSLLVADPRALRGRWRELLPDARELRVELGCGKGRFTAETAAAEPDVLLIAVEKVPDAMVVAMERAQAAGLHNVFFVDGDAACREIGSPKVLNMVMLGAVLRSDVLPLTLEEVTETMERTVKPQFRELNRKALHIQG